MRLTSFNPVETAATQLDMIHERIGVDVGVYGLNVLDLVEPFVFDVVND